MIDMNVMMDLLDFHVLRGSSASRLDFPFDVPVGGLFNCSRLLTTTIALRFLNNCRLTMLTTCLRKVFEDQSTFPPLLRLHSPYHT